MIGVVGSDRAITRPSARIGENKPRLTKSKGADYLAQLGKILYWPKECGSYSEGKFRWNSLNSGGKVFQLPALMIDRDDVFTDVKILRYNSDLLR